MTGASLRLGPGNYIYYNYKVDPIKLFTNYTVETGNPITVKLTNRFVLEDIH